MPGKDFFELVKKALPIDVSPEELLELAPERWWLEKPRLASAYALRKCPRINWDAYRECNEDVRQSGADPCLHYLKHGIYEGRKLISWHPLKGKEPEDAPLVSILIANYNNEIYLEKCIQSAISQTIKNIEIIIVDDCSVDGSRELINIYIYADKRVRAIFNETNSGLVNVRRKGVEAARGRYIMFLDSDDYLAVNACEIAADSISRGYDLVKFGAFVTNPGNAPISNTGRISEFINMGKSGELSKEELIEDMFVKRSLSWHIWTNIYLREICQKAYQELEDGYFNHPEDAYAMTAITGYIRKAYKIDNKLAFYNISSGLSTTTDRNKLLQSLDNFRATCGAIKKYLVGSDHGEKYSRLLANLCYDALEKLILSANPAAGMETRKIADVFGIDAVLEELLRNYSAKIRKIASLVPVAPARKAENIGILYPHRSPGGIERWILDTSRSLAEAGHKVTVFAEARSEYDLPLPQNVDICYLPPFGSSIESRMNRMRSLEREVKKRKTDLMIHAATRYPYMFWDLVLLHYLDIPLVFAYHYDQTFRELEKSGPGEEEDAVFRQASAVICFSRAEEQRMRARGINAFCLRKPVKMANHIEPEEIPAKIAVMGRFGDPVNQIEESLKVMSCIVAQAPWVSMHFIGNFYTDEQRNEFEKKIRDLGLERNARMYGCVTNPEKILGECGVFLSTARWGVAPAGIMEALALGLPVVMYEIGIEQAKDNPSIISVPQGDYVAAASKVLELLEDEKSWRELSSIAVRTISRYSPENYANAMKDLIESFQRRTSCYAT